MSIPGYGSPNLPLKVHDSPAHHSRGSVRAGQVKLAKFFCLKLQAPLLHGKSKRGRVKNVVSGSAPVANGCGDGRGAGRSTRLAEEPGSGGYLQAWA